MTPGRDQCFRWQAMSLPLKAPVRARAGRRRWQFRFCEAALGIKSEGWFRACHGNSFGFMLWCGYKFIGVVAINIFDIFDSSVGFDRTVMVIKLLHPARRLHWRPQGPGF